MRNIYQNKKGHISLTQGSILTNCITELLPTINVWGCVITPRCDICNKKVSTVHYLPIVTIEDWIINFLRPRLYDNWKNDLVNKINNAINNANGGRNVLSLGLQKEDLEKIVHKYIIKPKQLESILKDVNSYFTEDNDSFYNDYILNENKYKQDIERLVKGEMHDYYLIEDWDQDNTYKVILLRDIRRISIQYAIAFEKGFFYDSYSTEILRQNDLKYKEEDALYYIAAEINSPYIEHIMQAFSYNFLRIGVCNMHFNVQQSLIDIIKHTLKTI